MAQKWDGNMTQEQFMQKDQCLLLNENDDIIDYGINFEY